MPFSRTPRRSRWHHCRSRSSWLRAPIDGIGLEAGISRRSPRCRRRRRNPASCLTSFEKGGDFTSPCSQTRGLCFGLAARSICQNGHTRKCQRRGTDRRQGLEGGHGVSRGGAEGQLRLRRACPGLRRMRGGKPIALRSVRRVIPRWRATPSQKNHVRISDLPGVLAGFVLSFAGFLLLAYTANPCASSPSERTSYVGGIAVARDPQPASPAGVENPYGLDTCDYWPSLGEKWLTMIGWLTVGLLGGAAASRIGVTIAPWRGSIAVAAGCMGAISLDAVSFQGSPSLVELLSVMTPLTLLAGLVGFIGGAIAKRFA